MSVATAKLERPDETPQPAPAAPPVTRGDWIPARAVPAALWQKYVTRAPRYTSYPAAPYFKPDFDRDAAARRMGEGAGEPLSIYVHVPFCQKRCLYCGCFVILGGRGDKAGPYISDVDREIGQWAERLAPGRKIAQLAFGGGTPTFLPLDRFEHVLRSIRERWPAADDAELSVEVDPRVTAPEYLERLADFGFNRFSFGVQDLDPAVQKIIGRVQSESRVVALTEAARKRGVDEINFDLLYGLPAQTPESIAATAKRVAAIGPTRVAMFGYAHVPWMAKHQTALDRHGVPDDATRVALWSAAAEQLVAAGYEPVGMDHFALPGDALLGALAGGNLTRNFMGYTTRRADDLVGIGVSAISQVRGVFAQNVKELEPYRQAVEADRSAWERGHLSSAEDALRRDVILELFCNGRVHFSGIEQKHGIVFREKFASELERCAPFVGDGLVVIDGGSLRVTPVGRYFVRNVCATFDTYLGQKTGAAAPKYSRTI